MMNSQVKTYNQRSAYTSPWTFSQRLKMVLWEYVWMLMCQWTPKPLNAWRIAWLRLFGARIHGKPFVHQRARIAIPWNLTLHDRACLGDGANAYCLDYLEIGEGATVAQEAYLCTGSHDFTSSALPLQTAAIFIGAHAFIGARAFILPGVIIGEHAIVGACSVVTRDVEPSAMVAGNPARVLKTKCS